MLNYKSLDVQLYIWGKNQCDKWGCVCVILCKNRMLNLVEFKKNSLALQYSFFPHVLNEIKNSFSFKLSLSFEKLWNHKIIFQIIFTKHKNIFWIKTGKEKTVSALTKLSCVDLIIREGTSYFFLVFHKVVNFYFIKNFFILFYFIKWSIVLLSEILQIQLQM